MAQKYFDPKTGEPMEMGAAQSPAPDANASAAASVTGGGTGLPRLPGNQQAGVNFGGVQARVDNPMVPPPPVMSTKDKFLAMIPGAMDTVKRMAMDPEVIGGTAGAIAGEAYGGPMGAMAGAGMGSSVARTGTDIFENTSALLRGDQVPHPPVEMGKRTAGSFVSGALGEGAGRMLTAVGPASRATETGIGRETGQFFQDRGVPVLANQLTDSTALNFMANVAKHGPGGKTLIGDVEKAQSGAVKDYLTESAHAANPKGTISIAPGTNELDLGAAGKGFQTDIAGQVKAASKTSGYDDFFVRHGEDRELKLAGYDEAGNEVWVKGPKMRDLHETRSSALKTGRKTPDEQIRQKAMKEASSTMEQIEKTLPTDTARQEYRDLADRYRAEITRVNNPTVKSLRRGKSDDVVDTILDSKLTNSENLATGTGHTNVELLDKVQKAAHPEAWQQLQADVIQRVGDRAMNAKDGTLDFAQLEKLLHSIDEPTKQKLFGGQLQDINRAAAILKQAQKFHADEAGRLFIAIRTGGAITGAATTLATGNIGAGLVTSAAVLSMPALFAKILTSPKARPLLIRALGKNPTLKGKATKELIKWGARNLSETAREGLQEGEEVDNTIPEPPQ